MNVTTEKKTDFSLLAKGAALLGRFSVKQRLMVFAGAGLFVLVLVTGLLIVSNTVVEGAVRLREKALEVDANLFRRQAQARAFIRLHDNQSVKKYDQLKRSGQAVVAMVAGNGGLNAQAAREFKDANRSLDQSFAELASAGIAKKMFMDSLQAFIVIADKSVAGLMSSMETREADLQMTGERLSALESEFLNLVRDGKIFFLSISSLIDEYSAQGDEKSVTGFKDLVSNRLSLFDGFNSFSSRLDDPAIKQQNTAFVGSMKAALALSDTVFGLTRREFKAIKEFDATAEGMARVTQTVLDGANARLVVVKSSFMVVMIVVVGSAAVLFVLLAFSIIVSITNSIRNLLKDMEQLGRGDLSFAVTVSGRDELSQIARALAATVTNLAGMISGLKKNAELLGSSTQQVNGSTATLATTAQQLKTQSGAAAGAAEKVAANVNQISASAGAMSTSVSSVATAIEEMSASLNEVAKNCQQESQITARADTQARAASALVEQLGSAAQKIEKVVDVISRIADQTNLLALNATIEAASAGAAGKGFAVVASEVKQLSKQTAAATEQIEAQIEEIQAIIGKTITAITGIAEIINQVNASSQTIVTAVEEQSSTINEIAGSMARANSAATDIATTVADSARRLGEVTTGIHSVDESVKESAAATTSIGSSIQTMTRLGTELQEVIQRFTV